MSRKFRFRFSAVERVRKIREDEALRALGIAQRQLQAEIARREELSRALGQALERRERLGLDFSVPGTFFRMENDYITGQKQRIIQQEQAISRARRGREKAMRGYLLARRQTRVIERLRERDLEEFRREQSKKEQKTLDDLTSMRFGLAERMSAQEGADRQTTAGGAA